MNLSGSGLYKSPICAFQVGKNWISYSKRIKANELKGKASQSLLNRNKLEEIVDTLIRLERLVLLIINRLKPKTPIT